MSLEIKLPQQLNAAQRLAILDAYIDGLDRGYILTMTPAATDKSA
jgi:hypothetical protein